jgi:hypothetical protein
MSGSGVTGGPIPADKAATALPERIDPNVEAVVQASHRLMMERLEEGLEAIEEAAASLMRELANELGRANLRELRERVNAVHTYLASLGEYLNQRDAALLDWIKRTDAERAEQLSLGPQLEAAEGRIRGLVAEQIEAVRTSTESSLERTSTVLEQRLTELTEQTWTDQLALRRDLMELSSEFNREHLQELDERLGRVTELVNAALGWSVDQVHDHIQRETLRSVEIGMADLIAAIDRRFVDLNQAVIGRIETMDRALTERADAIDGRISAGLGALEEAFAERAGDAVEAAVERRLAPATDDLARTATQLSMSAEAVASVRDDIKEDIIGALTRAFDDRTAQLARMIRSDNRALADRLEVVEEQAAAKEAIRAVNELAAAVPGEINDALDQRLTILAELIRRESRSYGEVVAKAAEALADRIDRTAVRIGDRFDREVETVVDQIGGTVATLASGIQRAPRARG